MKNVYDFLDTLNLGEVEVFESYTQEAISNVFDNGQIGKYAVALVTIYNQRTKPEFTFEDAKKLNPIEALEGIQVTDPKVTTQP